MQTTVEVADLPTRLDEVLRQAHSGTEVIVTKGHVPQAKLIPLPKAVTTRVPGLNAGGVHFISDDFDDPLPDEFWTDSA